VVVCVRCGTENPDGFRFCGACAAALDATAPVREVRKTVTVLFCDVVGSTALGEQLDAEALRAVMRRYFDAIDAIVRRHGGTTEKFIGDAALAVFGIPRLQEDDALRAVRAAAEIRERLPALGAELGVALAFRTGVNTGPVVAGVGQTLATGDAINVAARLQQAADPGEILIGADTWRMLRESASAEPVGAVHMKGKTAAVPAFRLLSVDITGPTPRPPADAQLIGRGRELGRLRAAYAQAVEERVCVLFTLLGAAGVGKSRLAAEFLDELGGTASVIRGRCLHYGEGITFWPIAEALSQLGPAAAPVLEQLSGSRSSAEGQLFWEVRRLLERATSERPLVLAVDDIQWAEPTLLDLLDHITDLSRTAPILLLCLARPDLLDARPAWAGGKVNATSLLLDPLGAADCERLVDELDPDLDGPARERIIRASAGNPLFVAEMLALRREAGEVSVPPTIQALLAARLEQLDDAEREAIECGAIEGEVFHRGGVRDLCAAPVRERVDAHLARLVRKELIRPESPTLAGDEAFRFRHLLIRDAAYEALPKRTRADLHERFARWLAVHAADLPEYDEIAGWHLEQTVRYRAELSLARDAEAASEASDHLIAAGRRAAARGDVRATENLLGRALELLPSGDSRRAGTAVTLAELLADSGDVARIDELLAEAVLEPAVEPRAALVAINAVMRTDVTAAIRESERRLVAIIDAARAAGDARLLGRAMAAEAEMHLVQLHAARADESARRAVEQARSAGDRWLLGRAVRIRAAAVLHGPAAPAELRRLAQEIREMDIGPLGALEVLWLEQAQARLDGRFDDARRALAAARETERQLGNERAAAVRLPEAEIEIAAGEHTEAIRVLRLTCDELDRLGELTYWSTAAALLAKALVLAGKIDEAETVAHRARAASAPEDLINFILIDTVDARIHLDRGALEAAERSARSALAVARTTDVGELIAEALVALASVLKAAADAAGASAAITEAIERYERDGDVVRARRARALSTGLAA
jgi:class 3 adenylate cyclase/tetratricopeptide (TPR) repeat protein